MVKMQDKILDMLLDKDEITWQSIIFDLVKSGELNPWDIDVSILTKKYIEIVRKMKEANLFVSAKVLLASALLLRIKSEKLLTEGIAAIDFYLYPQEDVEELDDFFSKRKRIVLDVSPVLTIKTPQARKRRVTVSDLLSALDKALEINERRVLRQAKRDHIPEIFVPEKGIDISLLIKNLNSKIKDFFRYKPEITFSELVGSNFKEDKLTTFVPLLHLANQSEVRLNQLEHFGEIFIKLYNV